MIFFSCLLFQVNERIYRTDKINSCTILEVILLVMVCVWGGSATRLFQVTLWIFHQCEQSPRMRALICLVLSNIGNWSTKINKENSRYIACIFVVRSYVCYKTLRPTVSTITISLYNHRRIYGTGSSWYLSHYSPPPPP
ncbi:hypothetical protein GDO81_030110 [Engystomops pustulosus]|uniref:Vomeronasal type-1 receptor n=1 Tax=Engystomops pustulosus TaxID=76066 RepID=A0AAV6YU41_ENGPU|nr:hypothetical protein GDO81_030110 [Engystomops pustulosus]